MKNAFALVDCMDNRQVNRSEGSAAPSAHDIVDIFRRWQLFHRNALPTGSALFLRTERDESDARALRVHDPKDTPGSMRVPRSMASHHHDVVMENDPNTFVYLPKRGVWISNALQAEKDPVAISNDEARAVAEWVEDTFECATHCVSKYAHWHAVSRQRVGEVLIGHATSSGGLAFQPLAAGIETVEDAFAQNPPRRFVRVCIARAARSDALSDDACASGEVVRLYDVQLVRRDDPRRVQPDISPAPVQVVRAAESVLKRVDATALDGLADLARAMRARGLFLARDVSLLVPAFKSGDEVEITETHVCARDGIRAARVDILGTHPMPACARATVADDDGRRGTCYADGMMLSVATCAGSKAYFKNRPAQHSRDALVGAQHPLAADLLCCDVLLHHMVRASSGSGTFCAQAPRFQRLTMCCDAQTVDRYCAERNELSGAHPAGRSHAMPDATLRVTEDAATGETWLAAMVHSDRCEKGVPLDYGNVVCYSTLRKSRAMHWLSVGHSIVLCRVLLGTHVRDEDHDAERDDDAVERRVDRGDVCYVVKTARVLPVYALGP